ncbi:MAG TPA: SEC-C metal-binding domain-containing protein [Pirellulales bacterium]|nr:SEC-C metal-binding domain-containing protein [Pirellulales bacterium]
MGAIAEGIIAYAQTLIDQTDGSPEQLEKALSISQACWNLALLPESEREFVILEMQQNLNLGDDEFADFRRSIIDPMILRHKQMFPLIHRRVSPRHAEVATSMESLGAKAVDKYPGTDRYAPCPCNSGKKYKFCCGKRGS